MNSQSAERDASITEVGQITIREARPEDVGRMVKMGRRVLAEGPRKMRKMRLRPCPAGKGLAMSGKIIPFSRREREKAKRMLAQVKPLDVFLDTAGDEALDLIRRTHGDPAAYHTRFVAELKKIAGEGELWAVQNNGENNGAAGSRIFRRSAGGKARVGIRAGGQSVTWRLRLRRRSLRRTPKRSKGPCSRR